MTQDVLVELYAAAGRDMGIEEGETVLLSEATVRAALVRTPETLDVDALVASLPAVRRRTDVQPMIPESAVRRLLTTLAAAPSPTPPEGLRTALKTFHWLAHPHGCDETKCKGALALAATPAPDPGAGPLRQATLDLDTLLYVRESIEGIQHVGGTVEPLGLIDSIIAIRAEVRGESETDR